MDDVRPTQIGSAHLDWATANFERFRTRSRDFVLVTLLEHGYRRSLGLVPPHAELHSGQMLQLSLIAEGRPDHARVPDESVPEDAPG